MKYMITALITLATIITSSAQNSDCTTALRICQLDKYSFSPKGSGSISESLSNLKSNQNHKETNSIWLFWDVEESGDFVFELDPESIDDDLDFTVFKSSESGCDAIKQVRSVLSGANLPSLKNSDNCMGSTGLSYGSNDIQEATGCQKSQDNFVKFVAAKQSERYYILINNYSSTGNFEFKLQGTLKIDNSKCIDTKAQSTTITESIAVYPSPAREDLFINVSTEQAISDMSVIDMLGRRVIQLKPSDYKTNESQKINVSSLMSGTYMVRAETESGVMERRFVRM